MNCDRPKLASVVMAASKSDGEELISFPGGLEEAGGATGGLVGGTVVVRTLEAEAAVEGGC